MEADVGTDDDDDDDEVDGGMLVVLGSVWIRVVKGVAKVVDISVVLLMMLLVAGWIFTCTTVILFKLKRLLSEALKLTIEPFSIRSKGLK